ncbi:MAG TPA: hypothetical protein VHN99_06490 [Deinococcales bacterium]|nr:hypothetical protein [Deinococcales bacterium]
MARQRLAGRGLALVACGLGGAGYGTLVARVARRQDGYQPVAADHWWYAILPLVASGLLLGALGATAAFFAAAATLGWLFIGVHNAWDSVTCIVLARLAQD